MPIACRISRLKLTDFRTYEASDLTVAGQLVALSGENGAGKTNVLEALSLLSQGRGLRRADLAEMPRQGGAGGFAVSAEIEGAGGTAVLGTGVAPEEPGRKARINRAPAASPAAFAEHIRVVWLTPDQDALFRGPPGDRRRFVDRLVLAVDPAHGSRVNALEKALRARNRLLEELRPDARWLDAAEHELAEVAVAVAAARRETVERLRRLILDNHDPASPFPSADIALAGDVETMLAARSAREVEDWHRAELAATRPRDRAAGRTLTGPQTSDLDVRHAGKAMPAALCSTGEQKALLVGLVLAHARLVAEMSGMAPLVLLDEIAAHFDPLRRQALLESLLSLGGQVWMTGADPAHFSDLPAGSDRFLVTHGAIRRMNEP